MRSRNSAELVAAAQPRVEELRRWQRMGLVCFDGGFVPAVHYPPITMIPPIDEEVLFATYETPADDLFDLYFHLPFCSRQCVFCHYPAKLGEQAEEKDRYLDTLEREMDLYAARLGVERFRARTILVGGGTPTSLSPAQFERFLAAVDRRVDMSACTQYSVDHDPTTILGPDGEKRLSLMRAHGVDRLTIGIQAMSDDILRRMNRDHTVADSIAALGAAREAGFTLNVELIFGYPGLTIDAWVRHMEQVISLGTEEIQLYRLKVIPYGDRTGTITRQLEMQHEILPSVEETTAAKAIARGMLFDAGWHEVIGRVFAKKPQHYSHYAFNQCCLLYDEIGFGLTAFSSLRDRFGLNTLSFQEYYKAVSAGQLPVNRGVVRTREEQIRWCLILPLKNKDVHRGAYEQQTGAPLADVFPAKMARLIDAGLIETAGTHIQLTPTGRFFADEVAHQFYHPSVLPFPREAYADGPLNPYIDNDPWV